MMNRKTVVPVCLVLFFCAGLLRAQTAGSGAIETMLSGYSPKNFTSEPVSDSDVELILKCGIKAPSARNSQLWKFTVVKDSTINGKIIRNFTPGNVLIFISGAESDQRGINVDFDCALATENMFIAAQSLGLGARIYGGPVGQVNSDRRQELEIPEGYRVVSILRIGHIDESVDAVSSASTRKSMEEVVTYVTR